jgi:hypothetical protein
MQPRLTRYAVLGMQHGSISLPSSKFEGKGTCYCRVQRTSAILSGGTPNAAEELWTPFSDCAQPQHLLSVPIPAVC